MRSYVVLTGGPGAGKTSLLAALAARGFACVEESARGIIRERLRAGLSPRPSPVAFAEEIVRRDLARYRHAPRSGTVFFDRSLLDGLGMLQELGVLTAKEVREHIETYPYHPVVFVLPAWREIYVTDAERDQTFEEAVHVHDSIWRWYAQCGYTPVTVPPASIEERCAFVFRTLAIPGEERNGVT